MPPRVVLEKLRRWRRRWPASVGRAARIFTASLVLAFGACAPRTLPVEVDARLGAREAQALSPRAFEPADARLVAFVRAHLCHVVAARMDTSCDVEGGLRLRAVEAVSAPSGPFEARIVRATAETLELEGVVTYLHVRGGGVDRFAPVDERWLSGQGAMSAEVGVTELRFVDAGEPVLVVTVESHWNDEDMGTCSRDGGHTTTRFFCVAREGTPTCGRIVARRTTYDEREVPCEDARPEVVSRRRGYVASVTTSPGGVRVREAATSPEAVPRALLGRHAWQRLITDPTSRWPDEHGEHAGDVP